MSELRFHPFLREWVITATHRQDRTFLPPAEFNPLGPTRDGATPTEIPFESYEIVVFENRFPSLSPEPDAPVVEGTAVVPVRPSSGVCEVVCYTDRVDMTYATLPELQIRKLAHVWRDRYMELSGREGIEYVSIFENKGREVGVTLDHPHGQIYAYPFVPPLVARRLDSEAEYFAQHGRPLTGDWLDEERGFGDRILFEAEGVIAVVPTFARWPYEVHVLPARRIASMARMGDSELEAFALAIQKVAKAYDQLFGFSMPYVMAIYQECSAYPAEFQWVRAEMYPPYRTAEKLKYLAGSEICNGTFINDTLPEESAQRLRACL